MGLYCVGVLDNVLCADIPVDSLLYNEKDSKYVLYIFWEQVAGFITQLSALLDRT
jgi:hypothetical protein